MNSSKWVEEELRAIDRDFMQDKMNAFGESEDAVAEHVEELVKFTSNLLFADVLTPKKLSTEELLPEGFEDVNTEVRAKQKHIEDLTGLLTQLSTRVNAISDIVHTELRDNDEA